MTKSRKSQVAIAVAAASLAGAGAAVAESSNTHSNPLTHGLRGGGPHRGGLDAAAAYLGLSQSALRTRLQSGKTLGEIADATAGKSKAGLIAALAADEKSHLEQAVKDGRLSQAQADAVAANIESRVTDAVNGTFPQHPDGGPPGDGPPIGDGTPPPA